MTLVFTGTWFDTSVRAETPFPLRKYFAENRALNVFIRQACFDHQYYQTEQIH